MYEVIVCNGFHAAHSQELALTSTLCMNAVGNYSDHALILLSTAYRKIGNNPIRSLRSDLEPFFAGITSAM